MLLSNLSAFAAVELVGRRALLVPGIFVLTLILLIMGIMGCVTTPGALWVILVCIFLWYVSILVASRIYMGLISIRAVAYQLTIGAVGFALGSEVSSLPLRAKVQTIIGLTQGVL